MLHDACNRQMMLHVLLLECSQMAAFEAWCQLECSHGGEYLEALHLVLLPCTAGMHIDVGLLTMVQR